MCATSVGSYKTNGAGLQESTTNKSTKQKDKLLFSLGDELQNRKTVTAWMKANPIKLCPI